MDKPKKLFEAFAIAHDEHRYDTCGDWWFMDTGGIRVAVSKMHNQKYAMLVAIHELIEATLCKWAGISAQAVTDFDETYELCRPAVYSKESGIARARRAKLYQCTCLVTDESEPGDDIHAPYYKQHQLATAVERMLAAEGGVSWQAYERTILALFDEPAGAEVASEKQEGD